MNVQEWGCFSIFLRADDVTRTMSKGGGVLVKNPVSAPGPPPPPPPSKILDPRLGTLGVYRPKWKFIQTIESHHYVQHSDSYRPTDMPLGHNHPLVTLGAVVPPSTVSVMHVLDFRYKQSRVYVGGILCYCITVLHKFTLIKVSPVCPVKTRPTFNSLLLDLVYNFGGGGVRVIKYKCQWWNTD